MTDAEVARLLRDVAEALRAGLPLQSYLTNPATMLTMPAAQRDVLADTIESGASITTAFERLDVLTPVELSLLGAGEKSGNFDAALDAAAEGIEKRRTARLNAIKGLAYPMLLLAAAGCILPLPLAVTGGIGAYLAKAIWLPLLVSSGLAFLLLVAPRLRPSSPFRTLPRALMYRLPLVGNSLRRGGHARFAGTLGSSIGAGIGMHEALASAISAADVPDIASRADEILETLHRGGTLTEAVQASRAFHPRFIARVAQAETTGRLPETLAELADAEAAVATRMVRGMVIACIGIVFLSVVIVVIIGIVSGFQSYLGALDAQIEQNSR
jgi:type II secretory pathway component PulF